MSLDTENRLLEVLDRLDTKLDDLTTKYAVLDNRVKAIENIKYWALTFLGAVIAVVAQHFIR